MKLLQRKLILTILIISLLSFSGFSSVVSSKIDVNILNKKTLLETLTFNFNQTESSEISYSIPLDSSNIDVYDEFGRLNFSIEETSLSKRIITKLRNSTQLNIKFSTDSLIFKNGDVYQFFTTFYMNQDTENVRISLTLPENYIIYKNQTFPLGNFTSNGKNIIINWQFNYPQEPISISVKFYSKIMNKNVLIYLLLFVATIIILLILYLRRYYAKKLLDAFDEDERKVIELVSSKRVIYQNKIEKNLGFSRSKMTRIVKKLEKKNLLKKEKRGRTNKLMWLGNI